jgi:hypothetical protein
MRFSCRRGGYPAEKDLFRRDTNIERIGKTYSVTRHSQCFVLVNKTLTYAYQKLFLREYSISRASLHNFKLVLVSVSQNLTPPLEEMLEVGPPRDLSSSPLLEQGVLVLLGPCHNNSSIRASALDVEAGDKP